MTRDGWTTDPVRRGLRAVGEVTGLVSEVTVAGSARDGDGVVRASASPASLRETLGVDLDREPPMGLGGTGPTTAAALTALLGEFCERYCTFHPLGDAFDRRTTTHARLRESDADVVSFDALDTVEQDRSESFGFTAFDETTTVDWVAGVTPDGGRRYVPVERVSLAPQLERTAGERRPHFYASSNGCACGSTVHGAVRRALYEAVERHALMRTWYRQETPPRLSVAAPRVAAARDRVSRPGVEHTLLDLGSVGEVSVVGVATESTDGSAPAFGLTASAALDVETAAVEALSEASQGYRAMREVVLAGGLAADVDLTEQPNLWACAQFYARPENRHHTAFLTEGPERRVTSTGERERSDEAATASVLESVCEAGVDPVVFDLTTPDVRRLGMDVVRVVTPSLVATRLPALPPVDHPGLDYELSTRKGHPIP